MAHETFIDTSGFYALLVRDDAGHTAAARWLARSRAGRTRAVTTDYVLDETATLLKSRGLGHLAGLLFDRVTESSAIRLEWVGDERFDRARAYFLKHHDHEFSFTDCTSFVLMRELHLTEALTKDGHFQKAGFIALLAD